MACAEPTAIYTAPVLSHAQAASTPHVTCTKCASGSEI
jgi:hypothetical protein